MQTLSHAEHYRYPKHPILSTEAHIFNVETHTFIVSCSLGEVLVVLLVFWKAVLAPAKYPAAK